MGKDAARVCSAMAFLGVLAAVAPAFLAESNSCRWFTVSDRQPTHRDGCRLSFARNPDFMLGVLSLSVLGFGHPLAAKSFRSCNDRNHLRSRVAGVLRLLSWIMYVANILLLSSAIYSTAHVPKPNTGDCVAKPGLFFVSGIVSLFILSADVFCYASNTIGGTDRHKQKLKPRRRRKPEPPSESMKPEMPQEEEEEEEEVERMPGISHGREEPQQRWPGPIMEHGRRQELARLLELIGPEIRRRRRRPVEEVEALALVPDSDQPRQVTTVSMEGLGSMGRYEKKTEDVSRTVIRTQSPGRPPMLVTRTQIVTRTVRVEIKS